MQKNELTNVLNSAISDLEKTRGLLNIAADELHRRGKREVQLQTLRRRSTAPAEYLEEDALIWSAETLETMICQLKAVHKRVKSNSKF